MMKENGFFRKAFHRKCEWLPRFEFWADVDAERGLMRRAWVKEKCKETEEACVSEAEAVQLVAP